MHPLLLKLGPITVYSYGLLVASAFLAALLVASRLAAREGLNPDRISSLGIYVAIAAIAGAKIFLILSDFSYYTQNPREIFSLGTLQAGGVFFGGLVAALLAAAWTMRRYDLPPLRTADTFAPAIALGHSIGRVGCFLAGCCWGRPASLPWSVTFTNPLAHELVGAPLGVPLHPTQIYESLAELIIFFVLISRYYRPHRDGAVIGLYLILYSAFRFGIEFVRDPADLAYPLGGPISFTQWTALALMAAGAYLLCRRTGAVKSTA
jgi:phosphatidylglycerol:prolipoprotein diacylglycerol transferase